jgi:hypothetical protein
MRIFRLLLKGTSPWLLPSSLVTDGNSPELVAFWAAKTSKRRR